MKGFEILPSTKIKNVILPMCLTNRRFLTFPYLLIAWEITQQPTIINQKKKKKKKHERGKNTKFYLAKSFFSGEVREATDEDSTIRIANNFGITKGIIFNSNTEKKNHSKKFKKKKKKSGKIQGKGLRIYRGQNWSKGELCKWRYREEECRFHRYCRLELDGSCRHRTLNSHYCYSFSFFFFFSAASEDEQRKKKLGKFRF